MGEIRIPLWNIEEMTGYKPKTTFWEDFSIADAFGLAAIQDTYNRSFNAWKDNAVYLTELSMVLNHKIWQHHEKNAKYAELYNSLWNQADTYAVENLKDSDIEYYYNVTD